MCGIAGILDFGGAEIDPRQIDLMNNSLRHRGPDDGGVYCDGAVGLGNRRLSIFDTSAEGHQPMMSASGRYIMTFNGSVYNWPEIRDRLKFDNWHSQSDTESMLEAYSELGLGFLPLLNGIFAFAIWDREERELLLVRDRVGIKPLFLGTHGNRLVFASEAKAIAVAGNPIAPNEDCIWDFLRWGLIDHDRDTFFKDIHHLEPGTWMKVRANGQISEGRYWDLVEVVGSQSAISVDDAVEQYADGLRQSISLNCRSDVPVCGFISSGVDSTILLSYMAQSSIRNLKAYTYDFSSGDAGELEGARELAGLFDVDYDSAILQADEVPAYLEKAMWHEEYPITSIRVLAYLKLYERARADGYIVVLDGSGGDQIGGGFQHYWLSIVMDRMVKDGPGAGVDLFHQFMDLYDVPSEQRLERLLGCMAATLTPGVSTQDGVPFVRPEFFSKGFMGRHQGRQPTYNRPFDTNLLNYQYVDLTFHNQRRVLRMNDRTSMAVACEQREPVLDHNLIELGFRSVADARVKGTEQRHYMREAARNLLPEKYLRKPKQSIVDPQRKWLKEELRDWAGDAIHSEALASAGILDIDSVKTEFANYCAYEGTPPTSFHIFQFINMALWYDKIANGRAFHA